MCMYVSVLAGCYVRIGPNAEHLPPSSVIYHIGRTTGSWQRFAGLRSGKQKLLFSYTHMYVCMYLCI